MCRNEYDRVSVRLMLIDDSSTFSKLLTLVFKHACNEYLVCRDEYDRVSVRLMLIVGSSTFSQLLTLVFKTLATRI